MDTAVLPATPPAPVRAAIRDLLTSHPEFQTLDADTRRAIAQGLVTISSAARALATEEERAAPAARPAPLARAQSAGSEFSGVAAQRVAGTTRDILNAVSFPRFVTELITGVFKALVDSNQQQMHAYVELIRNVAASTEGFADANVGLQGARTWLAERFPGSFIVEGDTDDGLSRPGETLSREDQAERDASTRLRLRPSASMPSEGALRTALGLGPQESVPSGDPETLVPLARSSLARSRQQMLSSMVMMGMQRIVIESGRLNASMRFHIDTRSQAADDRGSTFDEHNDLSVAGSYGFGPWGVEAKMKNTIGYVSTQRTQTTEEMNTDLDLNSSVELVFKTDYLPLDRLAGAGTVDRIRVNTLNPDEENRVASAARQTRIDAQTRAEGDRRTQVDRGAGAASAPIHDAAGDASTTGAAAARRDAAAAARGGATADTTHPGATADTTHPGATADTTHAGAAADTTHPGAAADTTHPAAGGGATHAH